MKLLIHAGPMKTGSTAFQELMVKNSELLLKRGIRFRWLRRNELKQLEDVIAEERSKGWPDVLLLSSEFLCRVAPEVFNKAFSISPVQPKAILVARRLQQTYPSLYLQSLKGPLMRTISYKQFLVEQSDRDRHPDLAIRGQVYHFEFLEQQFKAAGFQVNWLRYSRPHLLRDLVQWIADQSSVLLNVEDLALLSEASGSSPRRSLDGVLVEVVRVLNRQCRNGTITASVREQLLSALLDSSDQIRTERQGLDCFRSAHDAELDALDDELNGDFWRERFPSQQS